MKKKGLLEWTETEDVKNAVDKKRLELGEHDVKISRDMEELQHMADEIGKDKAWVEEQFSREMSDLAQDRKNGLLPKYKAAKIAGNEEEANKIKIEMAILTQIINKKEAELQKELIDLDMDSEGDGLYVKGAGKSIDDEEDEGTHVSDEDEDDKPSDAADAAAIFNKVDPNDETLDSDEDEEKDKSKFGDKELN